MVQKVTITLVDDVDGNLADETVLFSLDGVNYEIDLTAEHAAELRDSLAHWVGHARRTTGRRVSRRRGSGSSSSSGGSSEASKMREWARANGYTVSSRGRIPTEVAEAYAKAH